MRYADRLAGLADSEGRLNEFIRLRDGKLVFADQIDLLETVRQYGSPLEISYCPQITHRVQAMQDIFARAIAQTGYQGQAHYAYATKANFAEEVVRTAIRAGAHYETSSAFDVRIAQRLWQDGILPSDHFIFCNGSKEKAYIDAIIGLRRAGFDKVVPIIDDLDEFEQLLTCPEPLLLGVRERKDEGDLEEGATYGYDRFGLLPEEMEELAKRLAGTKHKLILYHAMVGSQLEDSHFFSKEIIESLQGYAQLLPFAPDLAYFNFGGGMPTSAYSLDFSFDYAGFVEYLLGLIKAWCDERQIVHPHVVGEYGRYTCADHGVHIFEVGRIKRGHQGAPTWYLLNGSLMVALPDILIVEEQQFIVLALNQHERETIPVILGGRRTCDSDDFYPRDQHKPLELPDIRQHSDGEGLYLAFFGTGAYQSMLSGEGGAHHCLAPEAPKLIIEEQDGRLQTRVIGEQSWESVLSDLGY